MFYFYMRVSLISDDEKNIKMKHISRMAEPQQTENVPRLRIKALPMTAPNAKAKTIAEEINALWYIFYYSITKNWICKVVFCHLVQKTQKITFVFKQKKQERAENEACNPLADFRN